MASHQAEAEADAVKTLFQTFASQFPQDDNLFIERAVYDQVYKAGAECPGVSYEEVVVADRRCLWARPDNASSKHALLFMHGGGFSFGSPTGHRKLTAHLANACNCVALSVDYRLSPEHKFPAAIDDCVAAYRYLVDSGFAASCIVVAGDSCGGCLATSVPLALAQRGLPRPAASVSMSPLYDQTTVDGGTMDTNEEADVLNTKPFVLKLASRYVDGSGFERSNPLISPLLASDEELKKLPPHWISVAGYDMLRDHGERMAQRLGKVGVEAVLEVHEGMQHVMEFGVGKGEVADGSVRRIGEWVRGKIRS
jgi:epsilon-lactone hydrolase